MKFDEPFPIDGRKCKEHETLFSSGFLCDFNFKDYYYLHPKASKRQAHTARLRHEQIQEVKVAEAKTVCSTCPFIDKCKQWGIECMEEGLPIYGVTGGLTQSEQEEMTTQKGEKNVI